MSSIADQITEIQNTLKIQAQRLGLLNLKNNNFLEQNENLAKQIVDIKAKVQKKKESTPKPKYQQQQKQYSVKDRKQSSDFQDEQYVYGIKKEENQKSNSSNLPVIQKPQKMKFQQPQSPKQKATPQTYSSTRGEYQPPILFAEQQGNGSDDNSKQSDEDDQDDDGDDILQKLRAKANAQDQDDDNDNENQDNEKTDQKTDQKSDQKIDQE